MAAYIYFLIKIAEIILIPIVTIWSINTLFGVGIAYTLPTWAAMVWVYLILVGLSSYFVRQ